MMARSTAPEPRSLESYADEVLTRFDDLEMAARVLVDWARHSPDVAGAMGVSFLDLVEPAPELMDHIRAVLNTKARFSAMVTETPEQREAFETYLKNFRF
jgi:hypothetical protein